MIMIECHSKNIKSCLQELKSTKIGLTHAEATKRISKYGPNELPKKKSLGKFSIFLSQFNNALVYILLIAGAFSVVYKAYVDAGVIFGAVIINVIIGFLQENKANQAISKLKNLVEHKAFVYRDGHEQSIDSKNLTIGDVIIIKAGNRISADSRLIESTDLKINESSLTGESIPSSKNTEPIAVGAALADRENMVYAGTVAVSGLGRAVVTAIGQNTEIGKIARLVKETKEENTPLQDRLTKFSKFLGIVFALVCLFVVLIGLVQKREFFEMVETGVALGVASIPEGLTVAVTFILALGMQRILRKRALTRKLVAAETLGSTTVICTDKTGTLTEGKMHVAHIIIGEKEFEVGYLGTRQDTTEAKVVSLALQTAMMCNDAIIENPDDELASWRILGSPTEAALLSAAIQSGLRQEKLLEIEPQIDELPFNSDRKYMLSLHKSEDPIVTSMGGHKYILYEKGAPEKLLDKSSKYYHQGKVVAMKKADRDKLSDTYEKLTDRGLRVMGLAHKEIALLTDNEFTKGKVKWDNIDKELTFIGFIAIKDPLRPEAKETIRICRKAGIRPVIITGDHKLTARAIANEVGLKIKKENILTGEELDLINDNKLSKIVEKIDIYARVSPHHKLRIVKSLQNRGEVVAMTGDGINDSPALKAADIGISLGTGTDIAKETSDIVLLDNNFKTIVAAIQEGRVIFKNIRKIITYLISDSFSEVILIVGSIMLNTPLAVLPAQILWINIINDGLPDFSLAFEKDHGTVMSEKPLKKEEPILNKEMKYIIFAAGLIRDFIIFGIFYSLWIIWQDQPDSAAYLRTFIFAILGVKSLFSIFSIRSFHTPIWKINPFSNKYLVWALSASMLLLVLGVEWGPLQSILATVGLTPLSWVAVFGIGLLSVLLIEIVKIGFLNKKHA